ncbi:hypothetical protein R2F25_38720 [Streptomyces sp. UP1A-1]|nr:hypothetical protein [Streptomyces sp. UP1A-1]
MVVGRGDAGGDPADVLAGDDVQDGAEVLVEDQAQDVHREPARGVPPQLVRAAGVQVEGDHHGQEVLVVEGGDVGEPVFGGHVQQPVREFDGAHGRLRDPVRAVHGPGL